VIAVRVVLWLLIGAFPLAAQGSRIDTTSGGVGPVTPTTFATYFARNSVDSGPLRLEFLILWHGDTNWFTDYWTNDEKGIQTPNRLLAYKFNGDSVMVDGETISLNGTNVILVEVEPTHTRVVETLYVDEPIPVRYTDDPIQALLRRHPRLAQFADMQP
jgi:hypothetical protein